MSSGLARAAGRAVGLVGEAGATGVQAPWGQTPACPWAFTSFLSFSLSEIGGRPLPSVLGWI